MTKSDTGPFALVPVWVLDSQVSALAIRVYAIHSDFADRQGSHYHSRKTIAARANCSVDALDRAHGELVKVGALTIERRRDEASPRQTSNLYQIVRVIHTPAAQMRLGGRVDAAGGGRVDAAGASLNKTQFEPLQVDPLTAVDKAKNLEAVRRIRKRNETGSEAAG